LATQNIHLVEEPMKLHSTIFQSCLLILALTTTIHTCTADTAQSQIAFTQNIESGIKAMVHAGLGQDDARQLTQSMIQAKIQETNILQSQDLIISHLQKGLPIQPVINKAFEGVAKKASGTTIVQAMKTVAMRQEKAISLASKLTQSRNQKMSFQHAIVSGLTGGIKEEDMEKFVDHVALKAAAVNKRNRSFYISECLLTARDLARRGVPSTIAVTSVQQVTERGVEASEMQSMRHALSLHPSLSPAQTLEKEYSNALQAGNNSRYGYDQNRSNTGQHRNQNTGKYEFGRTEVEVSPLTDETQSSRGFGIGNEGSGGEDGGNGGGGNGGGGSGDGGSGDGGSGDGGSGGGGNGDGGSGGGGNGDGGSGGGGNGGGGNGGGGNGGGGNGGGGNGGGGNGGGGNGGGGNGGGGNGGGR
jgi:hypothetical protein